VAHLVVCDPRKYALLKTGNKNDQVDARRAKLDEEHFKIELVLIQSQATEPWRHLGVLITAN